MKKLILCLSVFALMFTSCGNDDDTGFQDSIIGTWTYHKLFIDDVEQVLTSCEKQEIFTFKIDGTVSYKYYEVIQGICELEESASGTWSNDGNNTYTFTVEGNSSSEALTFVNNTFYYEYSDLIDPFDPVFATYREVYIRN